MRRARVAVAAVAAALAVLTAGCDSGGGKAKSADATASPGALQGSGAGSAAVPAATVAITPADGGKVALGQPVSVAVTGGKVGSVTVTADDGSTVAGAADADPARWRTTGALHIGTHYTDVATGVDASGHEVRQTSAFTTAGTDKKLDWTMNVAESGRHEYGVGMPVSIMFKQTVTDRAAVERALTVSTEPKVEGSWSWVKDINQPDGRRID
ncbi:MAG: L,D-transpeptidase, partial [Streptomycetaceae bacterium]|nr:L,D-transpeptidase [Streptomycetaceae bacterium]